MALLNGSELECEFAASVPLFGGGLRVSLPLLANHTSRVSGVHGIEVGGSSTGTFKCLLGGSAVIVRIRKRSREEREKPFVSSADGQVSTGT